MSKLNKPEEESQEFEEDEMNQSGRSLARSDEVMNMSNAGDWGTDGEEEEEGEGEGEGEEGEPGKSDGGLQKSKARKKDTLTDNLSNDPSLKEFQDGMENANETTIFLDELKFKIKNTLEDGMLTIESMVAVNQYLVDLKDWIADSPAGTQLYRKIQTTIQKIEKKTFDWKVHYRSIRTFKEIFGIVDLFFEKHHFVVINMELLQNLLPVDFFISFLKVPYHSYDEQDQIYFRVQAFHSLLLACFRKLYIIFPLGMAPRIDSSNLNLVDPFMREHFRSRNRDLFRKGIGLVQGFDLVFFLQKILEKFVFSGLPRWVQKSKQPPLLVPLLELIAECFDLGLIESKECDLLLSQLYMVSELLASLEGQIQFQYPDYVPEVEKYLNEFIRCRVAIAKMIVHIIAVYCDFDFLDSVAILKAKPDSTSTLRYFILDKSAAYGNISLIVLKYLSPKLAIAGSRSISESLQHHIAIIFNFIGNYEDDFFTECLSLIRPEYAENYLQTGNERGNAQVLEIVQTMAQAIGGMRKASALIQTQVEMQFMGVLEIIKKFLGENPDFSHRLELTKYNIPAMLLRVIDFLDRGSSNPQLISSAIEVMSGLLKGNYPGQSVLFSFSTFDNYKALFSRRALDTMSMLQKVFGEDDRIFHLASHVFLAKIKIYRQLIKDFRQAYIQEQTGEKFLEILASLFYFNYFFHNILGNSADKVRRRRRYDLVIAEEIVDVMVDFVFPAIHTPNFLPDYSLVDFQVGTQVTEIRLEHIKTHFAAKQIEVAKFELYLSFLRLFNKSVFFVYSGDVFEKIQKMTDTGHFWNLPSGFPEAICIRLEMLKLFDRFHIFFPNHLLTKREVFNPNRKVIIGENFLPENVTELSAKIKDEFLWFETFLKVPQNNSASNTKIIGHYLIKGLLPAVYKYLKGVYAFVTIMEDPDKIATLNGHCDELVDLLTSNAPKYKNYIANTVSKAIGMLQTFELRSKSKEREEPEPRLSSEEISQEGEQSQKEIWQETAPQESDILEERINPKLRTIRERIMKGVATIESIYRINAEYYYMIARYRRNSDLVSRSFEQKTNKRSFETKYSLHFKELSKARQSSEKFIVKAIKNLYRARKAHYNENYKHNRFVQLLSEGDNSISYNRSIAEFFIEQTIEIESCMVVKNYEKSFYLNEVYSQLFIIMNNLLTWTSLMREELFKIIFASQLKRKQDEEAVDTDQELADEYSLEVGQDTDSTAYVRFFQAIWGFYLCLLNFNYFKTFMDEDWEAYWEKFLLISQLMQNLSEDNFTPFKKLLNTKGIGMLEVVRQKSTPSTRSAFFENYIVMEVLAMNSNSWLNRDSRIVPSDRSELFPLICRVIDNVTEMLTGPCLKNQKMIFTYRSDMWAGIIYRIIDDLDSSFYQLKLSCLMYISALMEGLDDQIVQYMSSNLEVHKLFDEIIQLTKKLFLKWQQSIENPTTAATPPTNKVPKIKSPDQLFALYNKFEDFSEHIIMQIVISTFVMLKNMSSKIKFYELFLDDKEKQARKFEIEPPSRQEEAAIFNFISRITLSIEVTSEFMGKEAIIKVYFKMPPRCFFLTSQMKTRFLEESPVTLTTAKQHYLYNQVEALSIEMKENQKKWEQYSNFSYFITNDAFRYYQFTLLLISVVLNCVMLGYLENNGRKGLISTDSIGQVVIFALGVVLCCLSFLIAVLWLSTKYRMTVNVLIAKHMAVNSDRLRKRDKLRIYFLKGMLLNKVLSSFLLQLIFSLLGLLVNNVFFTLNLLLLTNVSKPINYIIRSIVENYDKLLVTLGLTILVIFSYSFLLYVNFAGQLADSYGANMCRNFGSCFVNSINLGLRLGGGIGDSMNVLTESTSTPIFWGRFFYDLSFFIMVRLILLNVIAGIIIDNFSKLRDELTTRRNDLRNMCPVCGVSRNKVEQAHIDFDTHISKDHDLWEYLFYLVKLSDSQQRDFSGLEYNIWQQYKEGETDWFPKGEFLKKGENFRILDNKKSGQDELE